MVASATVVTTLKRYKSVSVLRLHILPAVHLGILLVHCLRLELRTQVNLQEWTQSEPVLLKISLLKLFDSYFLPKYHWPLRLPPPAAGFRDTPHSGKSFGTVGVIARGKSSLNFVLFDCDAVCNISPFGFQLLVHIWSKFPSQNAKKHNVLVLPTLLLSSRSWQHSLWLSESLSALEGFITEAGSGIFVSKFSEVSGTPADINLESNSYLQPGHRTRPLCHGETVLHSSNTQYNTDKIKTEYQQKFREGFFQPSSCKN